MRYIAIDVEAAGSRLGVHPTLSIGACPVQRESLTFEEYFERDLVFYAELRPESLEFETEAMRIGSLQLQCLERLRLNDPRYDPTSMDFWPELVLMMMQQHCEDPTEAMSRFRGWVSTVSGGHNVEGVTDTVFFDGGQFNLWFAKHGVGESPFGWTGLDLTSLYRGQSGREDARLSDLGMRDPRTKPHRADHDAVFLAMTSAKLLYDVLGW